MKKIILSFFLITTLITYSQNSNNEKVESSTKETEVSKTMESSQSNSSSGIESAPTMVVTKSDSFMAAFGMGDSNVVSGGEGGDISSPGQSNTAVAGSVITSGSSSLTGIQNTPYMK